MPAHREGEADTGAGVRGRDGCYQRAPHNLGTSPMRAYGSYLDGSGRRFAAVEF